MYALRIPLGLIHLNIGMAFGIGVSNEVPSRCLSHCLGPVVKLQRIVKQIHCDCAKMAE